MSYFAKNNANQNSDFFAKLGNYLLKNSDVSTVDGQKEIFDRYNSVDIASLPPAVLQAVFASAKLGDIQKQIQKAAALASIDYQTARDKFLAGFESKATARLYSYGLNHLETFCDERGIDLLSLKISDARNFIHELKTATLKDGSGMSVNCVLSYVGACSSFFSWLRIESDGAIELNPFANLGKSDGKPKARLKQKTAYPTKSDVETYVEYFQSKGKDIEAMIVQLMAFDGFRAGAFESMEISDKGRAGFTSKGKTYTARRLSKRSLFALNGNKGRLFENYTAKKIANEIQSASKKLIEAGKLSTRFSPHDFRHFYATELYKATKDVRKVQIALGHSNIAITDTYLRGLGMIDD